MATQLQIRRGTTAQMNAFTGAEGELAVNTTTDTLHVHDGATAGGKALARADGSNIATYAGSFTTLAASGAVTLSSTLAVSGALTVDTNTLVVDATNNRVGIGTSSPTSRLQLDGAEDRTGGLTLSAGGQNHTYFLSSDFVNVHNIETSSGAAAHTWQTNGAERMRLTAAGALQLSDVNSPNDINTAIYSNSDVLEFEAFGTNGAIAFSTGSGVDERFRVDSAGRVGIGTSSASELLHLSAGAGLGILLERTGGAPSEARIKNSGNMLQFSNNVTGIRFDTGTSPTERFRIEADGTLISSKSSGIFFKNSSGGTSSTQLQISNTGGDLRVGVESSSGGSIQSGTSAYAAVFGNQGNYATEFTTNGTVRLSINNTGAIFATGVRSSSAANNDLRYNTSNGEIYYQTSSERYKSNIVDLEFDTSNLYNLRPVSFDDNETGERCFGLIAEDTFEQIPEAVVTRNIDGETVPDSIPYSMLSVLIINEMKKLKAENDSLKSRIEALENN